MPGYDYYYLGDNARAPYGPRSFDVVYEYTRQAVRHLFDRGCRLVILGCNTASAKALRTIQQHDLIRWGYGGDGPESRRVLGVIRPTTEVIGTITRSRHVGLLATEGTIRSHSYELEIRKLHPDIILTGQACPLWAAIVEAGEADSPGADYFVGKRIGQLFGADPLIDTVILGCTHYPLLMDSIRRHVPPSVTVVSQGSYVATALDDYLRRHPALESTLSRGASTSYFTTENAATFDAHAALFLSGDISSTTVSL